MVINKVVFGTSTLIDLTEDTVEPSNLLRGISAHDASGNRIIGSMEMVTGVTSFNTRSGSVMPITGDYTDNMVLLSSTMHIGGGTQTNVKQAIDALTDDGGHTIKNNAGTILPQEINLKFDGRLTAVDENGQTVVKMNDVVTTPVSCLVGDEYVTITNSAIHTTSTIIMFWGKNQSTVTPVFYDSVEYAEGELTINFNEPLKVATSVYLQIINYPTSSGGAVSSNRTGVYGHTVIDNTGTALANRPYMKFDGRITAVDDSTNNQTVVKLKDVVTPSVSCLLGDEEVTITNSAIHTTSNIQVFFQQSSPIYGVGWNLAEVSEGSITIYFVEPLPKATDVYLVILN